MLGQDHVEDLLLRHPDSLAASSQRCPRSGGEASTQDRSSVPLHANVPLCLGPAGRSVWRGHSAQSEEKDPVATTTAHHDGRVDSGLRRHSREKHGLHQVRILLQNQVKIGWQLEEVQTKIIADICF